jgi:hypothetical protein
MDSAGDTICDFDVQFGNDVFCETVSVQRGLSEWHSRVHTLIDAGLADISYSRTLDHVSNREAFDRLILGDCSRAVGTSHELHMPSTLLVTAAISSLLGLCVVRTRSAFRHPIGQSAIHLVVGGLRTRYQARLQIA